MVVTGGGSGMHDLAWLRRQLPDDERVSIANMTDHRFCLGLWGPRARDVLAGVTDAALANDAFPYMTMREVAIGEVPAFAQRISYVGELGWELYGPIEMRNPATAHVTSAFGAAAAEVAGILAAADRDRFRALFEEVREFFGPFTHEALEQSSFLIDRLVERQ